MRVIDRYRATKATFKAIAFFGALRFGLHHASELFQVSGIFSAIKPSTYLLPSISASFQAVRLESAIETRIRYLILVCCIGVEDTEENIILGVDIVQRNATVGLVLPVWADTEITLNGDG